MSLDRLSNIKVGAWYTSVDGVDWKYINPSQRNEIKSTFTEEQLGCSYESRLWKRNPDKFIGVEEIPKPNEVWNSKMGRLCLIVANYTTIQEKEINGYFTKGIGRILSMLWWDEIDHEFVVGEILDRLTEKTTMTPRDFFNEWLSKSNPKSKDWKNLLKKFYFIRTKMREKISSFLYLLVSIATAMVGYTIHHSIFWAVIDFIFVPFVWCKWLIFHEVTLSIIKQTFQWFFN